METNNFKVYYDNTILTHATIHVKRPDIALTDKHFQKTYIIDKAVPTSNNIRDITNNKISKYGDLAFEIKKQNQNK